LIKAAYYKKSSDLSVICTLCPHNCQVQVNNTGTCGVRRNSAGHLISTSYGIVSALNQDPIEKKPLYHFYPGSTILSMGSFGCNLRCNFCQNHSISQVSQGTQIRSVSHFSPEEISIQARNLDNNLGLAFTYNEPIVWIEYMLDIASRLKDDGLKTVMISNGYINSEPLKNLIPYIDAYNIDLKSFDDNFYKHQTGGSLKPVLKTLKKISSAGKHLEITMLLIPGLNDDRNQFLKMIDWIYENCGDNTVLHLSKYFPNYKSNIPLTPDNKLIEFYNLAKKKLYYTYLGNTSIATGRDTICPNCSNIVIERKAYIINRDGLDEQGNCTRCDTKITYYSSS
jgi:pyruvate formate lyase activating enzyme